MTGHFGFERRRALGRALHALVALGLMALTGPWRDGAFGSKWMVPLLVLAYAALALWQFQGLKNSPDRLPWLRNFTLFADPAVFALFLCDAPAATAFLAPYGVLLCLPVGRRYGVAAFWRAWAGMMLTLPLLLYAGHPFWRQQPYLALSLLCLALLLALFFPPWHRAQENRLRQDVVAAKAQALEAAMVAKSAFLARASHQLRSPLQAIVSALELMDSPADQAMRQRLIDNISASATKLSQELRDLLTLARSEAWQLQLEPSAFEAGMLLDSVAAEVMAHPDYRGQRILKVVPPAPTFLIADSDKIVQVLAGISRHVLTAMRPEALTLVLKGWDMEAGSVTFIVKGELPALARDTMADSAAKHRDDLSDNLSLTLVRTLVDFLGGSLETDKPSPTLREFRVNIPCECAPEDGGSDSEADNGPEFEVVSEPDSKPIIGAGGESPLPRVLVLAPQPPAPALLSALAAHFPAGVEYSGSWPVAANRLAARPYALLLVDTNLPKRGAMRLATALKANQGGAGGSAPRIVGFNAPADSDDNGSQVDAWPFDAVLAGTPSRRDVLSVISEPPPGKSQP